MQLQRHTYAQGRQKGSALQPKSARNAQGGAPKAGHKSSRETKRTAKPKPHPKRPYGKHRQKGEGSSSGSDRRRKKKISRGQKGGSYGKSRHHHHQSIDVPRQVSKSDQASSSSTVDDDNHAAAAGSPSKEEEEEKTRPTIKLVSGRSLSSKEIGTGDEKTSSDEDEVRRKKRAKTRLKRAGSKQREGSVEGARHAPSPDGRQGGNKAEVPGQGSEGQYKEMEGKKRAELTKKKKKVKGAEADGPDTTPRREKGSVDVEVVKDSRVKRLGVTPKKQFGIGHKKHTKNMKTGDSRRPPRRASRTVASTSTSSSTPNKSREHAAKDKKDKKIKRIKQKSSAARKHAVTKAKGKHIEKVSRHSSKVTDEEVQTDSSSLRGKEKKAREKEKQAKKESAKRKAAKESQAQKVHRDIRPKKAKHKQRHGLRAKQDLETKSDKVTLESIAGDHKILHRSDKKTYRTRSKEAMTYTGTGREGSTGPEMERRTSRSETSSGVAISVTGSKHHKRHRKKRLLEAKKKVDHVKRKKVHKLDTKRKTSEVAKLSRYLKNVPTSRVQTYAGPPAPVQASSFVTYLIVVMVYLFALTLLPYAHTHEPKYLWWPLYYLLSCSIVSVLVRTQMRLSDSIVA